MLILLRPRFWPGHLAMIVCVSIAVGLGVWQYDAWETRRAEAARDISDEKPVALDTLMTGDSAFPGRDLGRPVAFDGAWVGDTVFIADRYLDDEKGYWVVQFLEVAGNSSAMPVVLGWVDRPEAPGLAGPGGTVTGWLQATEGTGPADDDPTDGIIPSMRVASLVEKLDTDLYSGYVVAREYTANGDQGPGGGSTIRAVTPDAVPAVSGFTALRNILYAVEWWIFAAFAFFVWFRWCADTLDPPEPEDDDA